MTSHTTIDIERVIQKLNALTQGCSPNGIAYAPTVSFVGMTIRALRQQQARIAELESSRQAMDAALVEAASVEVVRDAACTPAI